MLTLTPTARAIAAFALAFTLVTGSLDRLGSACAGVVANLSGTISARTYLVTLDVVSLVAGVVILMLAPKPAGLDAWVAALAQAARVLAIVGLVITAISLLSATGNAGLEYGFGLRVSG